MSFQPERPRRFGPPRRACLLAYAHLGLSLLFVAFVYYGYVAAPGSLAFRYVVEAANERSFPATWFAMVVLGSGIASVMRAHMCGVLLHPDGIQSFEVLFWSLPKVRHLNWPVIDRLRFDGTGTISVDLWNGTREYLPEVQDHEELTQALAYIAEARAIPYVGDPKIAFDESYLANKGRLKGRGGGQRGRPGVKEGGLSDEALAARPSSPARLTGPPLFGTRAASCGSMFSRFAGALPLLILVAWLPACSKDRASPTGMPQCSQFGGQNGTRVTEAPEPFDFAFPPETVDCTQACIHQESCPSGGDPPTREQCIKQCEDLRGVSQESNASNGCLAQPENDCSFACYNACKPAP